MKKQRYILLVMGTVALNACVAEAKDMSYEELVSRLYDMKYLATQPRPGEKSGNFSSWDRGAKYDKATGKYENWFANSDGNGFMDHEGTMMKLEGPGVIWRIWSAMPKKGAVKFYVDGSETPVLEGPFIEMFNNTKPPFNFPELVHMKGRGQNFFIPIPFQKSIRIVGEKEWGKFYQITYTKFPEGTTVPSFSGKFNDRERAALQKANEIWGKRGPRLFVSGKAKETTVDLTLEPGKEKEIALFNEPGAISSMVMKRPEMDREASVEILRQLSNSITWDKEKDPAVWAPLGDFFGTAGGENLYRSLATGMTTDSYYANWYMPFGRARIVVRNDGKTAQTLRFAIHTEKVKGEVDNMLRYHCKWHRDNFSGFDKNQLATDRWPDWPVLKVDGAAGRFCGFQAHMWNPNSNWNNEHKAKFKRPFPKGKAFEPGGSKHEFYAGDVSQGYWWGEGDEKFFVDGEKMPSTFGTGTEDYFGYAWGTAEAYDSALQAQPLNGGADEIGKVVGRGNPGNFGHITMLRWQVADNIPFQKSFEAVIEKYHPNEWPLLNAYAVSWYQTAGTDDYYKAVPPSERSNYFIPATMKAP
jgi:hypothetical protein